MRPLRLDLLLAASTLAGGCAITGSLDQAVLAYDTSTADSVSKLLLLNIARANLDEPMHFTSISNIAATYKVSVSAGIGPAQTGDRGGLVVPTFGVASEENPTVSIAPMQGDDFTQHLLTPFPEAKLALLLQQDYDVDSLLRLIGASLRLVVDASGRVVNYANHPSDRDGYVMYRRVMAQLSSIQDRHALSVQPLYFQRAWTIAADAVTPETFGTTYKDFTLARDPKTGTWQASKRVVGRLIITNYDPGVLSNDERLRLHAEAEEAPPNEVLIDIRSGFVGGEIPMHGRLRLRSFHEILQFVGHGIAEEPEFDVPPDPRTPAISENPVQALAIARSTAEPRGTDEVVAWKGAFYSVAPDAGYPWNRKAFGLLYQLFQMSLSSGQGTGPAITISK